MTLTTEPLLTQDDPLMTPEAPINGSDAGEAPVDASENVNVADDATPVADMDEPLQPSKTVCKRTIIHLPESVYREFIATAEAERRLPSVVLHKALEEFLEQCDCEPRPYVNPMLKVERNIRTQPSVDSQLIEQIDVRADIEERSRNALILRAVLNYLENHKGGMD